jgi:hypothetical protein
MGKGKVRRWWQRLWRWTRVWGEDIVKKEIGETIDEILGDKVQADIQMSKNVLIKTLQEKIDAGAIDTHVDRLIKDAINDSFAKLQATTNAKLMDVRSTLK